MQGHNVRIWPAARTVPDRPTDPPEVEAKACATCYWYEPCPCGRCVWGVCRHVGTLFGEYMHEDDLCHEWEEA